MLNWGYAGVPCGDFRWWDGDQTLNKLRWCAEQGFRSTGIGLGELEDPARREAILALRAKGDLTLCPHYGGDWWKTSLEQLQREGEEFLRRLERHHRDLHAPIVCCTPGHTHRFHPERPLAGQLEHLARILTPVAAGCAALGCRLAIENHGDYYCSDLVDLCAMVPGLGILLDTGNCFLIGERPLEAARTAASLVLGTHLKDHRVFPSHKGPADQGRANGGLAFCLDGAPLGEGDVQIEAILRLLLEASPDPEALVLMWEMVPPKDMNAYEALERSWQVCRRVEASLSKEIVQ